MKSSEYTYIHVLKEALWGGKQPIEMCADTDWSGLDKLCRKQGTAPLVYNELLKHSDIVPKERMMVMRQVCMQNMLGQQKLMQILKQSFVALEDKGVKPVLLKGFGLAQLYPLPYLRSWGDLDVYVGPGQYHQAAAILRETYPDAVHHDEEWEELKHYNFNLSDGNVIEMHRTTIKMDHPRDIRIYYALEDDAMRPEVLQEVDIEGAMVYLPEAKFNMLFTFLHAVYHFVEEGMGMKQLADVALLAHETYGERILETGDRRQGIGDRKRGTGYREEYEAYMRKNLKALRLMEMWQIFGYVCVKYLGLPQEEWPLYKETRWVRKHGERLMARVMEEGQCRESEIPEKYGKEFRNIRDQWNVVYRKLWTFNRRLDTYRFVKTYSPEYARHLLATAIVKGLKRTIKKEEMIPY